MAKTFYVCNFLLDYYYYYFTTNKTPLLQYLTSNQLQQRCLFPSATTVYRKSIVLDCFSFSFSPVSDLLFMSL